MKKVLVILPYANSHLELFIQFIQKTYEVDFYIHTEESKYRKNIQNNSIILPSIGYFSAIKNLLRRKYEIIFTHGIFYPYVLFLHLSRRNKIIVLSEGFNHKANSRLKDLIKRIHIQSLSKKNSISIFMLGYPHIKQQYEALKPSQIRYFQYGMFPALLDHLNVKSVNKNPIKFVYAGQFITRKNIQLILDSITSSTKFHTGKAEFTFIGDGPEVMSIRSTPNVKVIKTQTKDQLFKILSDSDILVLVSAFEGWGAIVNEACSCGCALVLSKEVGAGSMFLKDKINGYYAETNVSSLSSLFDLMINNPESLQKMKDASLYIFQKQYQDHDQLLENNISDALR